MNGFENNILLQADDFYEAYSRCIEPKHQRFEDGRQVGDVVNVPAIVNAAFACELYLKSLIGKELQTHDLSVFYRSLKQEIKEEIEDRYRDKKVFEIDTAYQAIKTVGKTFVEWRYLYKDEYSKQCNPKDLNIYLNIFQAILPILKEVAHLH